MVRSFFRHSKPTARRRLYVEQLESRIVLSASNFLGAAIQFAPFSLERLQIGASAASPSSYAPSEWVASSSPRLVAPREAPVQFDVAQLGAFGGDTLDVRPLQSAPQFFSVARFAPGWTTSDASSFAGAAVSGQGLTLRPATFGFAIEPRSDASQGAVVDPTPAFEVSSYSPGLVSPGDGIKLRSRYTVANFSDYFTSPAAIVIGQRDSAEDDRYSHGDYSDYADPGSRYDIDAVDEAYAALGERGVEDSSEKSYQGDGASYGKPSDRTVVSYEERSVGDDSPAEAASADPSESVPVYGALIALPTSSLAAEPAAATYQRAMIESAADLTMNSTASTTTNATAESKLDAAIVAAPAGESAGQTLADVDVWHDFEEPRVVQSTADSSANQSREPAEGLSEVIDRLAPGSPRIPGRSSGALPEEESWWEEATPGPGDSPWLDYAEELELRVKPGKIVSSSADTADEELEFAVEPSLVASQPDQGGMIELAVAAFSGFDRGAIPPLDIEGGAGDASGSFLTGKIEMDTGVGMFQAFELAATTEEITGLSVGWMTDDAYPQGMVAGGLGVATLSPLDEAASGEGTDSQTSRASAIITAIVSTSLLVGRHRRSEDLGESRRRDVA